MSWFNQLVGYQIYIRSFYDSNQDGIGDIPGIIAKLDYLAKLGVNLLWITPFYPSPLVDNGYDVSDFCNVDEKLGNLEQIKQLIDKAHQKNMKIMFDLVLNQTSHQHPWFIKSIANDPWYRDFYIWKEGSPQRAPNNWGSFFGGSAWCYQEQRKAWYLKIFDDKMPDLNWQNPHVREAIKEAAKFWLDLGIDGFRIDAIAHLAKDWSFRSSRKQPQEDGIVYDWAKFSNRVQLFEYCQELYRDVFAHYDIITIGEVGGGAKFDSALKFIQRDAPCFDMVFNFDNSWCVLKDGQIDVFALRNALHYWISRYQKHGYLAPQYYLNHDHPRLMSQYGNLNYFNESGKVLALVLLTLYGIPFIFNGEEIGMTSVDYTQLADFKDAASINYIKQHPQDKPQDIIAHLTKTGRDSGHLPFQWDDSTYAGFSQVEPYLKINDNKKSINLAAQINDKNSLWSFYQKMIHLRLKSEYSPLLCVGDFKFIDLKHPHVLAYQRSYQNRHLTIYANLSDRNISYPIRAGKIIVNNYPDYQANSLAPYQGLVIYHH